ncbi:MAG TPA: C-type lectin domain-containing protein [Kofleriaceae bacterium]|nr:C-type lectin domain-containing protein [Kofleriaceae bacterium]
MKWLIALVALAGCDKLFSVTHVPLHVDSGADAPLEACPTVDYVAVGGTAQTSKYRYVSPKGLPWDAAELDCETDSLTKITHLVVFDDPSEMAAVRSLVPASPPYWQVFTGYARNADAQGGIPFSFTSVTGTPIEASSPIWEKVNGVEPDNGGTMFPEETITFFEMTRNLTDGPASMQLGYICECDGKVANQTFKIR